jgi:hypothetical protein
MKIIIRLLQTCIKAFNFWILLFCLLVSILKPLKSNNILPFIYYISIYNSLTRFLFIDVLCLKIIRTGMLVNSVINFIIIILLFIINYYSAVYYFSILFRLKVKAAKKNRNTYKSQLASLNKFKATNNIVSFRIIRPIKNV